MKKAFTLVELMVVITIIGIMAALGLSVMLGAQNAAKEQATKATIAKLHGIVMQQYESYRTRRVPVALEPCPSKHPDGTPFTPAEQRAWFLDNQWKRLYAIRDMMRMEMPDAKTDVTNGPIVFTTNGTSWSLPAPSLHRLYASNPPTADHDGAQCLYLIVSRGNPEAMEQFRQDEIGTVDGKQCFIDGWGNPIMFLRWAPGYRSPIQSGDVNNDHDPFDAQKIDGFAFHLIPLIYSSAGRKKDDGSPQYGIDLQAGYIFAGNPYAEMRLGQLIPGEGGEGNITNHLIESR